MAVRSFQELNTTPQRGFVIYITPLPGKKRAKPLSVPENSFL
jgi:hypothetical protein